MKLNGHCSPQHPAGTGQRKSVLRCLTARCTCLIPQPRPWRPWWTPMRHTATLFRSHSACQRLRWIQAPAAKHHPWGITIKTIESSVIVTNQREIYNDHIGAHISGLCAGLCTRVATLHPGPARPAMAAAGDCADHILA